MDNPLFNEPEPWPRRCKWKGCRARIYKHSHKAHCSKHHARLVKARNPLRYYYNLTKQAAKQRGKPWELPYDEYERLAIASGYDKQRGREGTSLSIDRIDNDLGYSLDNIRITTKSENGSKKHRQMFVPFFKGLSESDKPEKHGPEWINLKLDENEPF